MYRVIFQNSRKQEREIGTAADIDGTYKIIDEFLNEHNYKSYYKRAWKENGRIKVDVGSWYEFMYIEKYDECEDKY